MTIIAAPHGFRLVRAFHGEQGLGDDAIAVSEIVLAFRIDLAAGSDWKGAYPLPITPTGTPDVEGPWLLLHPDGGMSMGGDQYSSFAEWKADMGLKG